MSEGAILEELRRQFGGLGFLPRVWFLRLVHHPELAPGGFPRDEKTLDDYLRKLEKNLDEIVSIRTQGGGAFYALRPVWDSITPAVRDALLRSGVPGRVPPGRIALLLPGPAALQPSLRKKVWSAVFEPGPPRQLVAYQSAAILGHPDPQTGTITSAATIRALPGQLWVGMTISTEGRSRSATRLTLFDDSGRFARSTKFKRIEVQVSPGEPASGRSDTRAT